MPSARYFPRPFSTAADLRAMSALVAARPPELTGAYPAILDLHEICGTPDGQESIRLWEDAAGALLGFTLLDGSSLAFELSPQADFEGLGGQMIAWAVAAVAAQPPGEEPVELSTSAREEDARRIAFLESQGFTAQPVRTLHFRRSLREPLPAPHLPAGFAIRPLNGVAEAADWVALHRAAHGTEYMTVDYRLSMFRAPEHDPLLDLVAVAPDGRLAAYVMCHFSQEENHLSGRKVGYTDPIATHPDYQGRGLARALLLEGFARLKARGLDFAEVSTWGENTAMIRTAESAGFTRCSSTIFFCRAP